MRRTGCIPIKNSSLDVGSVDFNSSKTGKSSLNPSGQKEPHSGFKLPAYNALPVKRATIRPAISPRRRVQYGRVKNEPKLSRQSRINVRPSSTFLHVNRKSIHTASLRNNQTKKELMKKMVYLAECAHKENKEMKQSTPVKLLAPFTPKKPLRSRGYLVLPEFTKKQPNIDELRTPIKDFVKKEAEMWALVRQTPSSIKKNKSNTIKETKLDVSYIDNTNVMPKSQLLVPQAGSNAMDQNLKMFQLYNKQVAEVFEQIKGENKCFETCVNENSIHKIYEQFLLYQTKREELNKRLKYLDDELISAMQNEKSFHDTCKVYIRENSELLNEQLTLHNKFNEIVKAEIEKCGIIEDVMKKGKAENKCISVEEEKPVLRRSLRLSKLPKKLKLEEKTPMKAKLSRLNNKSKIIHKLVH